MPILKILIVTQAFLLRVKILKFMTMAKLILVALRLMAPIPQSLAVARANF
jgi:hypothetical protein